MKPEDIKVYNRGIFDLIPGTCDITIFDRLTEEQQKELIFNPKVPSHLSYMELDTYICKLHQQNMYPFLQILNNDPIQLEGFKTPPVKEEDIIDVFVEEKDYFVE